MMIIHPDLIVCNEEDWTEKSRQGGWRRQHDYNKDETVSGVDQRNSIETVPKHQPPGYLAAEALRDVPLNCYRSLFAF